MDDHIVRYGSRESVNTGVSVKGGYRLGIRGMGKGVVVYRRIMCSIVGKAHNPLET